MTTHFNLIIALLVAAFVICLLLQIKYYRKIKTMTKNVSFDDLDIQQSNDIRNHSNFVIKIACSTVGNQLISRILAPDHVKANDVIKALQSKSRQVHQAVLDDLKANNIQSSFKREYRAKRLTMKDVKPKIEETI
ncbi:hypothetical protein [Pedobacter zeae]|nr:hypothetical protein [Pedobacter zeae]MBB4106649.1 hypothetical protein [Pedobacter zeae]